MEQSIAKDTRRPIEINWERIFGALIKGIWLILVLAIIFGVYGYWNAEQKYRPVYSTFCTFGVSPKAIQTTEDTRSTDIFATQQLTSNFTYLLRSTRMLDVVAKELNIAGGRGSALMGYLSITTIEGTSFLKMTVTTGDKELTYNIANCIINNYEKVVQETIKFGSLTIIEYPVPPSAPSNFSNSRSQATSMAMLGAVIGIVLLIVFELLRNTIKTPGDVQSALDLSMIGNVPMVSKSSKGIRTKGRLPKGLLITDADSGFTFVETYKSIRTKIETLAEKNGYKKFLIASTIENEGKTTVAANIAISLAQNGKSVLLIDADLRKPAVHKILSVKRDSKIGLLPFLKGEVTWKDSIKYVDNLGIFVLLSGSPSERSAEHLSSPNMQKLMTEIENDFDYIIVDSSPANMVTDSAILSGYCDAVILVVKQDAARVVDINKAVSDLEERGTPVAGCIFNVVNSNAVGRRLGRKFYWGYYYKSYGYGYGTKNKKKRKL